MSHHNDFSCEFEIYDAKIIIPTDSVIVAYISCNMIYLLYHGGLMLRCVFIKGQV